MTAKSELFVSEDISELVNEKLGYRIDIEIPDEWFDIWDDRDFPEGGTAFLHNTKTGEVIGKVHWKTTFDIVKNQFGERYIKAIVKTNDISFTILRQLSKSS